MNTPTPERARTIFSLTAAAARSYCPATGSPLRRLRTATRRVGTGARASGHRRSSAADGARAAGARCGAREGAGPEEGGRGTGPEEIGAATQRRLLGAFPRPGPGDAHALAMTRGMRSHPPGTVRRVTHSPGIDALLAGLDAHQRAAVVEPHTPLAILAPAGSGKTRVLTRRIAYRVREGHADAKHVLAVTFTRRAAGELVDRLEALGVDGVADRGHVPRPGAGPAARPGRRPSHRAAARARSQGASAGSAPPRPWGAQQRRRRGRSRRGRHRDRVGEGAHDPARPLRGGGPRGRPPPPPRRHRARRPLRRVRSRQAASPLARLRRSARRLRPRDRNRRRVRRRAALALPRPVRRRVPGRHAAPAPPPPGVARRPHRPQRRRRCRPGDLRVRRRRRVTTHRVSRALRGRSHDQPRVQLPVERVDRRDRGSRARSGVGRRARPAARRATGRASVPDHRVRRRRGGSRHGRRRVLARVRRWRAVAPHGGALPHQRAVGAVRDGVETPRRPVPCHRRGPVREPARGARPARPVARGRTRGARALARRPPRRPRRRHRRRRRATTRASTATRCSTSAATTSTQKPRGRRLPASSRGSISRPEPTPRASRASTS